MRLEFKAVHWHWTCGDGCCSDSGYRFYLTDLETNRELYFLDVSLFLEGIAPGWVVFEAAEEAYQTFGQKNLNYHECLSLVFKALGLQLTELRAVSLPSMNEEQIKLVFSTLGFNDVEVFTDEEGEGGNLNDE